MWPFLWHLNVSGSKKDLLQRGHTNPTCKCTLHTCVQMVAQEVDGPSLQPSTWHLYILLTPPQLNMKELHVGRDLSLYNWRGSWRGRFQCLLSRTRGFRFLGLLKGQVTDGVWQTFLWGDGAGGMEECDIAPIRSPWKPSEPATATSIFSKPQASKCCASISNFWASSHKVPTF